MKDVPAKNPKEYAAKHYVDNKARYLEYTRRSRQTRKDRYASFMSDKHCIKCGESEKACLDWHHVDPKQKDMNVARLLVNKGWALIMAEIAKCVCLCANCHRKLHAGIIEL